MASLYSTWSVLTRPAELLRGKKSLTDPPGPQDQKAGTGLLHTLPSPPREMDDRGLPQTTVSTLHAGPTSPPPAESLGSRSEDGGEDQYNTLD